MIRLPGTAELLVILIIIVILFGARRFALLGSALGRTVREIQDIPRTVAEDRPEEARGPEVLDLEDIERLRSNVRSILNPRYLLMRILNWILFRIR